MKKPGKKKKKKKENKGTLAADPAAGDIQESEPTVTSDGQQPAAITAVTPDGSI